MYQNRLERCRCIKNNIETCFGFTFIVKNEKLQEIKES